MRKKIKRVLWIANSKGHVTISVTRFYDNKSISRREVHSYGSKHFWLVRELIGDIVSLRKDLICTAFVGSDGYTSAFYHFPERVYGSNDNE